GVVYRPSIGLSIPAPPVNTGGSPQGSVGYVPAPASAYSLRATDLPGSYAEVLLDQSEDGRYFHHVIAAPDLSLLKVDEFPDGIPYSPSRIAVVDTQIFIL